MAKTYIVTFRTLDDRRPSKFIVLANNMKSAINMAWERSAIHAPGKPISCITLASTAAVGSVRLPLATVLLFLRRAYLGSVKRCRVGEVASRTSLPRPRFFPEASERGDISALTATPACVSY